jgi:hypothetical protein
MQLLTRTQEWLADRISWVQYPNIRAASANASIWKTQMPWTTRALLVLVGVVTLAVTAGALFFIGLLAWATITA